MTHHHRHLTRALMIAALAAGAWTAHELADDTAAHAGDKNTAAVAEQPGGVLGHLPEQAADRAREVIDQVATDRAADEPEPTRAETPVEPAPTDEPSEDPEPPVDEPAADPIVEAPPVEAPPVVETPPAVEPAPVVVEPAPATDPAPTTDPTVITLPSADEPPLPDAEEPTWPRHAEPGTEQIPALPAVVLPAPLPVLIGPVPAAQPPASIVAHLVAADPEPVADCADNPEDAVNINRDAIRQLIANLTEPAASPRVKPAHGCPGTPGNPLDHHGDCASTTATSSGQTSAGQLIADLAGSLTAPALIRLTHARARSSIPAGRHVAIEPGPA